MIGAVVVTYSASTEVLERCLRALVRESGLDTVVVVDTGGTASVPDGLSADVVLVRTENRGYGAAANTGIATARHAGADRFLVLNDDVVAEAGFLNPLVAELDADDAVGVAQPMLVTPDGDRVVSLGVELDATGAGHDIGDGDPVPGVMAPSDLEIFTGGAMLLTVEFVRSTGGFDERFFLYYEDVDLATHGARLGWRYRLVPGSVAAHDRGTSTSQLGDETRYLQERNRLWIAFRYGSVRQAASAVWLSVRRLRHAPRGVHARALVHGVTGVRRRRGGFGDGDQPL